ncbi:MAG TPA: DUF1634 domain-containing protein [Tepidisphaeraceae bacterium]|jgi:uncharacterized membrane protein
MNTPTDPNPIARHDIISDVSAWVLRGGVICSSLVMLIGIIFSFAHGTISVTRIKTDGCDYRPDIIWNGILHGEGKRIIEAGIYLLLFTPIMRVFASSILFAFQERDKLYTVITLVVLILTLAGLLWIG